MKFTQVIVLTFGLIAVGASIALASATGWRFTTADGKTVRTFTEEKLCKAARQPNDGECTYHLHSTTAR
jgi:hypothetical protein